MLGDLSGSTAVVTGAGGGLGQGNGSRLGRTRCPSGGDRSARAPGPGRQPACIPGDPLALELDVTSLGSVTAGAETVLAAMGPPHILINNAGIASATMGREGARDRDEDWTASPPSEHPGHCALL